MGSVRVAIVGVGNCASSLVQGVEYYKDADPGSRVPGLMHVQFGPYHVRDVEFVAAFDVDAKKVGRDLAEAIGASENNTIKICDVPPTGIIVQRGPTMDGLGQYYHEMITESDDPAVDVVQALRDARADVLVSYLPFEDRGVELLRTYQLNFGGNMDFMNMLERSRLQSKKVSKTQSVTSQIPHEMEKAAVHIGPSDHVPWLDDRKWAYVRLEGKAFGDVPLNLEYKLEVWDSPNSAGVIIDAVRAAKIALDRGIGGPLLSAASYFMKSPPEQYGDDAARDAVEKFIRGEVPR